MTAAPLPAAGPGLACVLVALAAAFSASPAGAGRPAPAKRTPLIPLEVIFGNPERISPAISPDGMRLVYIAPDSGVLNVWVRTVGQDDDRVLTRDRGRGIRTATWSPGGDRILYLQDTDGDENWHLWEVPAAGGEPRDLTPREGAQAQIIAIERGFPKDVLVGLNDRDPQLHDVYRVNLDSGELTLEVKNDLGAVGWVADHLLRVRLAVMPRPDGGFILMHRPEPGAPWKELIRWSSEDALTTSPLGFGADNETVYMRTSDGSETAELRTVNAETGGDERRLAIDPHADVAEVLMHPTLHTMEAVAWERDRLFWRAVDTPTRLDFEALARVLDGDFRIVSQDNADRTWVVAFTRDDGPVTWVLYDRTSRTATRLFSARPRLENRTLARMTPVSFPTVDTLTIHGYLTLPSDEPAPPGKPAHPLPAVVDVHGGPWMRDSWGYDPEAQWLANRGYAVLQLNFRGSTGYGKHFVNAGDREWGGKMQDDITAGVKWLVAQGFADSSRIAIYGGSYGGFAVLSGLTTTPALYACGVDMVGPSNLATWINAIPPYWAPMRDMLWKRVGNPEKDAEFLRSRSPLFHVDAIRAPLLIAQGKNDPRVKREESLQIKEALERAGKEVQYLEFDDEGHGFARPENRLAFYHAADKFLARHLGGRSEK